MWWRSAAVFNWGRAPNVHKGVVVVGGSLHRDAGARVGGEIQEVGFGEIDMSRWRPRGVARQWWPGRTLGSAFSLVSTLVRVGMLCLLAALVLLFGRDYVSRVGSRAAAEPLKAGAIGLLVQLLFLPLLIVTTLLFVITIVGIPLLILIPFAILLLMVLALVGFTGVASYVGHELTGSLRIDRLWTVRHDHRGDSPDCVADSAGARWWDWPADRCG